MKNLLNDRIYQRDELDEARLKENEEHTNKYMWLDAASKTIREYAINKMGGRSAQADVYDGLQQKMRHIETGDLGDDELKLLKETIEEKWEKENQRLKIEW